MLALRAGRLPGLRPLSSISYSASNLTFLRTTVGLRGHYPADGWCWWVYNKRVFFLLSLFLIHTSFSRYIVQKTAGSNNICNIIIIIIIINGSALFYQNFYVSKYCYYTMVHYKSPKTRNRGSPGFA